jgi:hypothetical protein
VQQSPSRLHCLDCLDCLDCLKHGSIESSSLVGLSSASSRVNSEISSSSRCSIRPVQIAFLRRATKLLLFQPLLSWRSCCSLIGSDCSLWPFLESIFIPIHIAFLRRATKVLSALSLFFLGLCALLIGHKLSWVGNGGERLTKDLPPSESFLIPIYIAFQRRATKVFNFSEIVSHRGVEAKRRKTAHVISNIRSDKICGSYLFVGFYSEFTPFCQNPSLRHCHTYTI